MILARSAYYDLSAPIRHVQQFPCYLNSGYLTIEPDEFGHVWPRIALPKIVSRTGVVFPIECRYRRKQQGRCKARLRRDSGAISQEGATPLTPEGKPVNTRLRHCNPCLRAAGSTLGVRVASCTRVLTGFLYLNSV